MSRSGSPYLHTKYEQELSLFPWSAYRIVGVSIAVIGMAVLPLIATGFVTAVATFVLVAAIGSVGIQIVTGMAGQLSLGHAAFLAVGAYRKLATLIDQPLHLGITEAGALRGGTVKSSVGLGMLLMDGIGDTIRVSLAADPVEEVKVGYEILKSLKLRSKGINFIACPSCSRQNFDVIATMNELEARLEDVTTPVDVAVIGCYVNGPGESKEVDIGVTGSSPSNMIYLDGKTHHKIQNAELVDHLEALIRERVVKKQAAEQAIIARESSVGA